MTHFLNNHFSTNRVITQSISEVQEDDQWFVALAPLPNPVLVVATRVERVREGLVAGQVARRVLEAFRARDTQ